MYYCCIICIVCIIVLYRYVLLYVALSVFMALINKSINQSISLSLSPNLSWRSHVMSVSRRVHFSLHKLKFHPNTLSRELRTTSIVSLIFPLIDYCCLVFNDLTNEMNTKLQQLINCGIRFIFDRIRRDVHISPYRRSLGWLSVRSRLWYASFVPLPSVNNYRCLINPSHDGSTRGVACATPRVIRSLGHPSVSLYYGWAAKIIPGDRRLGPVVPDRLSRKRLLFFFIYQDWYS